MIRYHSNATLYSVQSTEYAGEKVVVEEAQVACTLMAQSAYERSQNMGQSTNDTVCFIDPNNAYCFNANYKLEGMSLQIGDDWYIIVDVNIHRHHLLHNSVDNVELRLNKSKPLIDQEQESVS